MPQFDPYDALVPIFHSSKLPRRFQQIGSAVFIQLNGELFLLLLTLQAKFGPASCWSQPPRVSVRLKGTWRISIFRQRSREAKTQLTSPTTASRHSLRLRSRIALPLYLSLAPSCSNLRTK